MMAIVIVLLLRIRDRLFQLLTDVLVVFHFKFDGILQTDRPNIFQFIDVFMK